MFQSLNSIDFQDKLFIIKKNIVKIIIVIVILVTIFFVVKGFIDADYNKNKYTYFEQKIVNGAKDYALNKTLELEEGQQIYIDLYTLNLNPPSNLNCSKSSGVVVSIKGNELTYSPYLICQDYQSVLPGISNVPTKEEYITLKGLNPMIINNNYEEPGYIVDSKYEVKVTNEVKSIPGLYTVNYSVYEGSIKKQSIDRIVIVGDYTNEDKVNNPRPFITLNGNEYITLEKGSNYAEPGFTGYDSLDGDITDNIKVYGVIDTNKVGEQTLIYRLTNTRGLLTTATRIVTIIDSKVTPLQVSVSKSNQALTTSNIIINIKISGNNYYYTVLPNNTKNYSNNINFEVSSNGTYNFIIYDHNYKTKKEVVTIGNIDNQGPSASCINKVINSSSTITVNANDSGSGLAGYSYSNGGVYTSYISSNIYKFNTGNRNAFVKIKDSLGNISSITCSLDPNSVFNNSSTITFDMNPAPAKTNLIPCGAGPSYNSALASKVSAAGSKSRWGVVAAATYLAVDFPYKIPYFWAGKYDKVGLNPEWGCDKQIFASGSERQPMGSIFPLGLDCTGYVKWAYVNGGFADNIVPRYGFGERNWGSWVPVTHTFGEIAGNSSLLNSIKPGDVITGPGHAALIVGVDDTKLKVAQSSGGSNQKVNIIFVSKTTGKSIDDGHSFDTIVFMDSFFEKYGK